MAYGRRRKSGIVLSGVFIGSTAVGAAQNSVALANPAGMLAGTSAAKNGIGSVGKVFTKYVPWKTIGGMFLLVTLVYWVYKYSSNPPVNQDEVIDKKNDEAISGYFEPNEINKEEIGEKDQKDQRDQKAELFSLSIFSQEEEPNFSEEDKKEDIRDIFEFLSKHFYKKRLDIEGTKLKVTVKDLKEALDESSIKKFEDAKSSHAELTDESEVEIEITRIDKAGYLGIRLSNLDCGALYTKYVDVKKVKDTIDFFNNIFKKVSSDNKKKKCFYFCNYVGDLSLYLLDYETMDLGQNHFVRLFCRKDFDSEEYEVDARENGEHVNNRRNKRAFILEYQYDGSENINIFDKLFFASSLFETFTEENKIFDFKKNLKFAEGVKLVVKSDTLKRIYCEDDESNENDESNDEDKNEVNDDFFTRIEEYLNENEEVTIEIVSFREKDFKFKLIGANGEYCFDAELAVQYADNDKGKLIEFYNYILKEAYEQKKIGYELYLKDDNGVVKVYEVSSNEPLNIDFAKDGLNLEKIKNLIDEQKDIEHNQKNVDNIENDV